MAAPPLSRARARLRGRDGFTLVEALAALAILGMLTVVVQRGLVMARTGIARSSERIAAEWVARSLLAEPLGAGAARAGSRTGVADGLPWTVTIEPLDLPQATAAAGEKRDAPKWRPMRVTVRVERPGRGLSVETIRLARVD